MELIIKSSGKFAEYFAAMSESRSIFPILREEDVLFPIILAKELIKIFTQLTGGFAYESHYPRKGGYPWRDP